MSLCRTMPKDHISNFELVGGCFGWDSVTFLGTWPTFFFLFLIDMYLYGHMTTSHMTAYLYTRAILLGTPLFPFLIHFLLFSLYGSL